MWSQNLAFNAINLCEIPAVNFSISFRLLKSYVHSKRYLHSTFHQAYACSQLHVKPFKFAIITYSPLVYLLSTNITVNLTKNLLSTSFLLFSCVLLGVLKLNTFKNNSYNTHEFTIKFNLANSN